VERSVETKYAKTADGLYLAYQVTGSGPVDLIEITNGTLFSIDATCEQPRWQAYVERIGAFCRLIRLDLPGIGLSDPLRVADHPTVERWASDTLAILDAEQITRAAVLGTAFGGLVAILLAASHPERTVALVLLNAYARLYRSADYPVGVPAELYENFAQTVVEPDNEAGLDDLPLMAPGLVGDQAFAAWWRRAGHRGASPATARAILAMSAADVRPMLGAVQAPTLVLHARDNAFVRVGHGRYLADHIGGARYVELPTAEHVPWASDADVTGEIEEFLTGARHMPVSDRFLATILFTDIVGSTEMAADLGDQRWRDRLDLHDRAVERQLVRFGGHVVKTTGDGTLATFDGPARAIAGATAIRDAVRQLGLDVRIGVHTGEVERRGDDVAGIAVHLAQRVQSTAEPGEVLVSRTVVDLVVGSGIEFDDRGEHELKGLPGAWRLFAVSSEPGQ
jgi:class 3 adenylate cyclase